MLARRNNHSSAGGLDSKVIAMHRGFEFVSSLPFCSPRHMVKNR